MFNTSVQNTILHEIEWVNVIEPDTENIIIRRMLVACWFDKARKRHTEYIKKHKKGIQGIIPENIKHAADGEKEKFLENIICHNLVNCLSRQLNASNC